MMGDWSKLPINIIRLIVGRLEFLPDIQRFSFVCLSWHSVAMERGHLFHPLLITSYEEDAETCNLYDPVDKKVFKLHLPELHNKRCCGTSDGWLITVDDDLVVRLLHPFSRAQVSLPPFTPLSPGSARLREDVIEGHPGKSYWKSCFVQKVIISSNPLDPDCVFVRVGGRRDEVSFCTATDGTWTGLDTHGNTHSDAMFYEGRLYVARWPSPFVWDISSNKQEGMSIWRPPCSMTIPDCEFQIYFVESSGDLLNVIRHVKVMEICYKTVGFEDEVDEEEVWYKTVGFEVFRLRHRDEDAYIAREPWERITCLGERALFVGRNQTFSLPAVQFPGYRPNCIYFTEDSECGIYYHDMGEFSMEDGCIRLFDLDGHKVHWPPVWFKQH